MRLKHISYVDHDDLKKLNLKAAAQAALEWPPTCACVTEYVTPQGIT